MEQNIVISTHPPKKIVSLPSLVNFSYAQQHPDVSVLEFRLDDFSIDELKEFEKLEIIKPWILKTYQENLFHKFLKKQPEYVDLDFFSQLSLKKYLKKNNRLIISAHAELDGESVKNLYNEMKKISSSFYKIVAQPKCMLECLKILMFFRTIESSNCIRFCIGEDYSFTRYFSLIDNHPFIYLGCKNNPTARGQILLEDLWPYANQYNNPKIFALIGDPVDKSISNVVYNSFFQKKMISAIYLKIRVQEKEFVEVLPILEILGFLGLSVTTPLKKKVAGCMNLDEDLIFNTILFSDKKKAFQTDVLALLEILDEQLLNNEKKILIIGCGDLAKSFIPVLLDFGYKVYIENRTKKKIDELKEKFPKLNHAQLNDNFDVVIQTSAEEFFNGKSSIKKDYDSTFYIETILDPIFTSFICNAIQKNKYVSLGLEFFFKQGKHQMQFFLPDEDFTDFSASIYMDGINEILKRY